MKHPRRREGDQETLSIDWSGGGGHEICGLCHQGTQKQASRRFLPLHVTWVNLARPDLVGVGSFLARIPILR